MPSFEGDALAAAEVIKNGTEAGVAVWGQFQGLLGGVNEPAKEHFRGAPTAVTLEEFLDGNGLLMEGVGGIKGANDFVDGMEQDTTGNTAAAGIALNEVAKIVNVHIGVCQGERKRLATGDVNRGEGCWHAGHSRQGRTRITKNEEPHREDSPYRKDKGHTGPGAHGPEGSASGGDTSASSSGGGVSANFSKRWGGAYRRGSRQFVISATVSVTAQKAGGIRPTPLEG